MRVVVYRNLFITFSIMTLFGIIFGWALFPKILNIILKKQIWLKPVSKMREMWSKTPFPLDFLIYVFNVTNPEEVINGGIPQLEEIGPYHFDEWKDKFDQIDDEEEDTVTYHLRDTFIFRPDKSNGLTGDEILIMPHTLLQSSALVVNRDRPSMLNFVSKALLEIFPNQTSFLKASFMDFFFKGIFVDCSSHEFQVKAVCTEFKSEEVKKLGLMYYNETHYRFSFFGVKNATDGGKLTACRGIKNIYKLGKILRYEDESEMDFWYEDGECNKFKGTDSTIFPPSMDIDDGIWSFTPDICRSLGAQYKGKSKYSGLPALRYELDLGDIGEDEKLHCFCTENDLSQCPVKGTFDLAPCTSAPVIASMPHFYNGDESLFRNVEGLRPTKEEHVIFVDFEIISGTPLKAAKRLQFNLNIEPIEEIESMENLRKMVFPLFWIEEGLHLNKTYVNMLKYQLFLAIKFNFVLKWICVIGGGIGAVISALMHAKKSTMTAIEVLENSTDNDKVVRELCGKDNNYEQQISTEKF